MVTQDEMVAVIGATGKTGSRVARILDAAGRRVRPLSRSSTPPFDWEDAGTWPDALAGCRAAYVAYAPDLVVPGAVDAVRALLDVADAVGLRRVVLLSGRGEEEAQRAEDVVRGWDGEWTIVRASWFTQNFSEGAFAADVARGRLELPVGDVPEPFVDVDDIAEVAAAALVDDRHVGRLYEVTGPEAITFADACRRIAAVTGRDVTFASVPPEEFAGRLVDAGTPAPVVDLLTYLFVEVLDGRNVATADGVHEALGRLARSFDQSLRAAVAMPGASEVR